MLDSTRSDLCVKVSSITSPVIFGSSGRSRIEGGEEVVGVDDLRRF